MLEIKPTIFRAYDIRGHYGKEIDPHVFYQIGLSAGTYAKQELNASSLTLGNDIRKTSQMLAHAFISGVTETGVNVIYTGTTSFGQTLFYGWKKKEILISFITASHLPPEWNGIKFYYGDGVGLPEKELNKIRDNTIHKNWEKTSWKNTGSVSMQDPKIPYENYLSNHFSFSKKLRIAVDCGGGSMTLSAPQIFKKLGIDVVDVFCTVDPLFSSRPSDPKPENLVKLVETVKSNNCDFGVAFDGDGDRSVIIDDSGNILSADQTGIIIGKYGLEKHKGTIIVNVECSKAVAEQLEPLGFTIKQIEVGHTFLTLHAKKEHAPLGIESSGHLILPSYYLFDDALVVPLKIAEILEKTNHSLSSIIKKIPIYPVKKIEISCKDEIKFNFINQLKEQIVKEYQQVNTLDGIRVNLDKGWVLIRASNTSPLIRLTVEADTEQTVHSLVNQFKEKVDHVINQK